MADRTADVASAATSAGVHNRVYLLNGPVEVDVAFVGSKRRCGGQVKMPFLFAVEKRYDNKGKAMSSLMNTKTVDGFNYASVRVGQRFASDCEAQTDACQALEALYEHCKHVLRVKPHHQSGEWLLLMHAAIGNLKVFLNSTFHRVNKRCLLEFIDELVPTRKRWKKQLARRLFDAIAEHEPATLWLLKI